ncbi:putative ATP-grasp-modified RiPP [Nonomuraea sp. NEAU-A123]|uniref:putative ATP-grasp-modified RiPP n=1 Tax=Nonomuraea sp. NEAU-A123 TaxID=2839649 RepID=UPI001BE4CC99|nr:putative ATP-grasp-modified RiPP [Nonomuraea sp. NEAU-A123]MBT2233261.1 putative ATP-grasp-modified RiPP [Nonomuraea sp. NEAU-A123]
MTLTQDQPVRPWGLGRMAKPSPVGPPEYATVEFDPATQLTHFYDAGGEIVDMQRGTVTKSPKNQGNDGTGGPLVSDDSDD